jgi:DNA-3-methyladenine glycosylase
VELARGLLGCVVVRRHADGRRCSAVIVETEAYDGPADRASHARFGRTARTATMFGPGGRAYVYLVYGMHCLLNVVAGPDGAPGAVLLRAVAPLEGTTEMSARRRRGTASLDRLAAGPALLTRALDVGLDLDGTDLTVPGSLWLAPPSPEVAAALAAAGIVAGPRIGVAYAEPPWAELAWRFGWRAHPALSRPFPRPTPEAA